MCFVSDGFVETVRPAYDEHHMAQPAILQRLDPFRKFQRGVRFTPFIEQDQLIHSEEVFLKDLRLGHFDGDWVFFGLAQFDVGRF